jgi:hypothetical protein
LVWLCWSVGAPCVIGHQDGTTTNSEKKKFIDEYYYTHNHSNNICNLRSNHDDTREKYIMINNTITTTITITTNLQCNGINAVSICKYISLMNKIMDYVMTWFQKKELIYLSMHVHYCSSCRSLSNFFLRATFLPSFIHKTNSSTATGQAPPSSNLSRSSPTCITKS